jgi:hypothetical protein
VSSRKKKLRERRRQEREARITAAARSGAIQTPPDHLVRLAQSRFGNERAFAFIQMSDLASSGAERTRPEFLQVAGAHLSDPDPIARDFAMHVVSSFAAIHPQLVWSQLCAAVHLVGHEGRRFLGVTILEELLEHHFAQIFPEIQREVAAGRRELLDALSSAWFNQNSGPHYKLVQEYLASQRRQSRIAA